MNRLDSLFAAKPRNILSVYCTAGFPHRDDTVPVLQALERAGVDMIEIGIPFSDPIADGPVIQESSSAALANGMTLELLFEQLRDVRKTITVPLVLMGYVNPMLQFGVAKFAQLCAVVGVDGVIVPDMPVEVFERDYARAFAEYGIYNILLVTPQTANERVRLIDTASQGFLYAVSSSGTTGNALSADGSAAASRNEYFTRLKSLNLSNPVMIGFGIADKVSFDEACSHANGAIVGSAFIKAIGGSKDLDHDISTFVAALKGA
jgi:tryptophan synthase alpha chain